MQAEVHGQRFLLGLLFRFDSGFQSSGQLDVSQQNVFHGQAALLELSADLIVNLLSHHLTLAGIKGIRCVRGRRFTNGRAQRGLDDYILVVGTDLLKNFSGPIGIEMVNQRSIQTHHQSFARRHARRFFKSLRLDRKLIVSFQRADEVNSLAQRLARLHLAEKREYAHVSGADAGHGTEQ